MQTRFPCLLFLAALSGGNAAVWSDQHKWRWNSDDALYNMSVKGHAGFPEWLPIASSHHNLLLRSQHSYLKIMNLRSFISGNNGKNALTDWSYENRNAERNRNILLAFTIDRVSRGMSGHQAWWWHAEMCIYGFLSLTCPSFHVLSYSPLQ